MSGAKLVNVHDAKTHFSKLLHRVVSGEEIIISKAGTPIAKLVPYAPAGEKRKLGILAGRVTIPDDFDTPLPAEALEDFEGV